MALLKTIVFGQTILDLLIVGKISILSLDEGYNDSFVPDFLTLYRFLTEQKNLINPNSPFFTTNKESSQLIDTLNQYESFDEIQKYLVEYLSQNPDSPLSKGLLMRLEPRVNEEQRFDTLKNRWMVEENRLTNTNFLNGSV